MSLSNVTTPYDTFTDARGRVISIGEVYIGVVNQDPETNPVSVYWDSAGTVVAAQPLNIINGYICRSGTPAQVFINVDYSIRLYDNTGAIVYYYPAILAKTIDGPAGGALTGSYPNPGIADAAITNGKIADNAVLNSNIVPGVNSTVKGTIGSIVTDLTAYDLNGILGRVGMTEYCEHSAWDTNLYYWMNGATLSRTTDARLFNAVSALLGTQGALGWGVGDGSTTFVLPDRRGMFNRGFATNNSIDPDGGSRVIGSKQLDAMQRITGSVGGVQSRDATNFFGTMTGVFSGTALNGAITGGAGGGDKSYIVNFDSNTSTVPQAAKTNNSETRPVNAATYWLVVR